MYKSSTTPPMSKPLTKMSLVRFPPGRINLGSDGKRVLLTPPSLLQFSCPWAMPSASSCPIGAAYWSKIRSVKSCCSWTDSRWSFSTRAQILFLAEAGRACSAVLTPLGDDLPRNPFVMLVPKLKGSPGPPGANGSSHTSQHRVQDIQ